MTSDVCWFGIVRTRYVHSGPTGTKGTCTVTHAVFAVVSLCTFRTNGDDSTFIGQSLIYILPGQHGEAFDGGNERKSQRFRRLSEIQLDRQVYIPE